MLQEEILPQSLSLIGRGGNGRSSAMRKQRKNLPQMGWIDEELAGCEFNDVRLNNRFRKLVEQLSGGIGANIPWACQDWANTKAAYRSLSNPQVNEDRYPAGTLSGHAGA